MEIQTNCVKNKMDILETFGSDKNDPRTPTKTSTTPTHLTRTGDARSLHDP